MCSEKKCTSQGQICVVNNHHQARCQCRESCPRSGHRDKVCGSDGITYRSRCVLDMTSCKVGVIEPITVVSRGKCEGEVTKSSLALVLKLLTRLIPSTQFIFFLQLSILCSFSATTLKVSAAHQPSQTLISGKRGKIHCGIEGRAVQVLWKKIVRGIKQRLSFRRVLALNSKTLHFHRVRPEDAGTYECRVYSGTSTAVATVTVAVTGE